MWTALMDGATIDRDGSDARVVLACSRHDVLSRGHRRGGGPPVEDPVVVGRITGACGRKLCDDGAPGAGDAADARWSG
jgi:hypothetical protein